MPRRSRPLNWLWATLDSKRMDLADCRDGHVWVRLQTLRLLLDVWGALDQGRASPGPEWLGGAARCYALHCCHTRPTRQPSR